MVQRRQAGRIKDARGRAVTQLDPVAMHLLRQHDVIEGDVLRAIASEQGVRITVKERAALLVGVAALLAVAGLFTWSLLIKRDFGTAPLARSVSLAWFAIVPWVLWVLVKRARFNKVAAAMLKHRRCPHCGYDLRLLPNPADRASVCPECGCAWHLAPQSAEHPA